jgi:phosphate uptake regulator
MPHAKPTAATVHTELVRHETECAERWRTNFKQLDKLEASMNNMKVWLLGGLTTIAASLFTIIVRGLL